MSQHTSTEDLAAAIGGLDAPGTDLPLHRRVAAVFLSPASLFAHLRQRPAWAAPLVVTVAAGILAIVLLPDQVFFESMQGATTRRGEPVLITSSPDTVARWERLRLSLGVAVTHPVKALLIAGFLMLVFSRLLRGTAEFRHYLAVTTHAMLISAFGVLLALPLQLERADATLRITPGLLLAMAEGQSLTGRLLTTLDIFTLWTVVVLGVGVAVVNRWRPLGVPVAVLVGLYLAARVAIAAAAA